MAADNFNRANNVDLGADWAVLASEGQWNISGNAAVPALYSSDCSEYFNGGSFANDQYSEAVLAVVASSAVGTGIGVSVRNSTTERTNYNAIATANGTELAKFVNGSYSVLDSDGTPWANGDTIRIEAQGTTVRVKRNGVTILSVTDASIASGRPGIRHSSTSSGTPTLDDWGGGDLDLGVVVSPGVAALSVVGQAPRMNITILMPDEP